MRAAAGFAWRHIALDRDPSHHSRVGGRRGHRLALTRQNRPPLGFLLIAPGLALTEMLAIREPIQRLALATAGSLALETVVAVTLLYARRILNQPGAHSARRG